MAGIGFELKKLFRRKGLFASLRAYGYAGIICTGPMLLGVLLQLGILLLCSWAGAPRDQQDLLVCMITYTLLFSLTVTSFFSMPVTRYLADMLYEEQEQTILPLFWGSSSMMLVLGCTLYGLFLLVSGATLLQGLLCLWLFAEMIVNWNGMSYLTAIKDYRGILCSFLAAIALAFGLGLVLVVLLGGPMLEGMLFAVTMGYGLMMVWDVVLLYRYFPQSEESPWAFLRWVDAFLPLAFTGLCTNIGLFAHLVICWAWRWPGCAQAVPCCRPGVQRALPAHRRRLGRKQRTRWKRLRWRISTMSTCGITRSFIRSMTTAAW